jgi:hypothetical protein
MWFSFEGPLPEAVVLSGLSPAAVLKARELFGPLLHTLVSAALLASAAPCL